MDTVTLPLIVGGLFIILGFAVKRFPQLIAGYNKMKAIGKNEKKAIPKLFKEASIGTGIVILIGASLCKYWGLGIAYFLFMFVPPFLMVVWLQIQLGKMDERVKKRSTWIVALFSIVFVVCIAFLFISYRSADVIVSKENIEITGVYGRTVPTKDIESVSLTDSLPQIIYRNGGFSLDKVKKGNFVIKGEKNVSLYLHSNTAPYIQIHMKDGHDVYLNYDDVDKMNKCYKEIKSQLEN